jgi:O-antigen ligase/tetratricopeptide (TPR) repeat protein
MQKFIKNIFFVLVCLSLLAPLWVFKDLLFPYVTSKAFYFRIVIELALPFYVYLLLSSPKLRPKFKNNPINCLILVFLVLNLVSAFTGVSVVRSLWGNFERMGGVFYLANLTLLYFYVLCLGQMGGAYLKNFLNVFLAAALVITVNGIFGKLGWPVLVLDPSLPARVSSTLGNPIYLGSYLIVPLFVALFLGKQSENKIIEWSYYFCALLFLIGVLLSGTRGAMVGLVVGGFSAAVVYLFFTPKRNIKIYGGVLALLFVAAYALLSVFNSHLPANSDLKRLFSLKDSNTEARVIQWGVALKGYKDYPLFGVGPENYYSIANKYYNPAIAQYDASWFDKPHNYILEILVTDGILGLLAYLGILVFLIWALYKGYKSGFLSLFEFCALLAGLMVYQIQNLTVFDTVPASLAFYCYMGLVAYIWYSVELSVKQKPEKTFMPAQSALPIAAFGVALLMSGYVIYAANVVPIQIAKSVNYGVAYASVDPGIADSYFQHAFSLPFNFDKTESADKYADFASGLSRSAGPTTQELAGKVNSEAIAALNNAIATQPDYPILWESLAEVYLLKGVQNGRLVSIDPGAEASIDKAIEIVPGREEAYLTLAQIKSAAGNLADGESILLVQVARFPKDTNARIQLANLYRIEDKISEAANLTEQAVNNGYSYPSYASMQWLVQYYASQKQFDKAIALQQAAEKVEPSNIAVFEDLAALYAAAGQTQAAITLAQNIMRADASATPAMQKLINSLQKSGSTATSTK